MTENQTETRRILVVDDDRSLLDLAEILLGEEGGHQVTVCQNPVDAERIIEAAEP